MNVRLEFVTKPNAPRNLLAECEIYFPADGPLRSMKLTGVCVRKSERGLWISFPSRQYEKNGKTQWFDYLRPADSGDEGKTARLRLQNFILDAYRKHAGVSGESVLEDADVPF